MLLLEILYYSFVVVVGIQVVYFGIIFGSFSFCKPVSTAKKNIPVSVIICAKNEAENIKKYLPSILNQEYPDFEVVLINDASHDETLEVFEGFAKDHKNIKIVNVKNVEAFWAKKKYALTLGIKAATHNQLLFTDADCEPVSNQWINEMASHFSNENTVILGYGAYHKIKKSFLNKLIRYETLLTAIQYFSFAQIGTPFMGVGRNLAYHRDEFFKANGFINHIDVRSGDDDLFINEVASSDNTAVCFTQDSFTTSQPKLSFKNWLKQKRRHISTAHRYKFSHKALLTLFYSSQFLFWALSIILLIFLFNWPFVILLIVFRYTIQLLVVAVSAKKLNETDLVFLLPVLELFLIGFQLTIFITNLISKPNYWK